LDFEKVNAERFIRLDLAEEGRLARLDIHLPPVNVLGVADLDELTRRVEAAAGASVLVLSGLPRAFSAGVEVADHVPEPRAIERMLAAMGGALAALLESRAVTVAAVSGACLGGGAEIAAACDMVLAAEDARIGFPEIRLGCFPPAAAVLLPSRIGETRAFEWILTGKSYSGTEAAAAGFATRAIPAASLARETLRVAGELLSRDSTALSAARGLLRRSRREALALGLPRAEDAYRKLEGSEALRKAMEGFKAGKFPSSSS
jgi:enoyl-CoA hydratase/carnithine racemase